MTSIKAVFLFLACVLLVSCSAGAPDPTHDVPIQKGVSAGIVEIGDMTYIPVNLAGLPEVNMEAIFLAIQNWQQSHPNREIVDVDYIWMQNTESIHTSNYTYGVSIFSRLLDR